MLVSAVVCTWNRAPMLRSALASLAAQTLPRTEFEILVVDNGSTDGTRDVVAREFAHVPNLRYLVEPHVGVSHARNTGWRAARGRTIAYLDDDAVAPPDWLARIADDMETLDPRPGILGGPCEPIWHASPGPWYHPSLDVALGLVDLGDELRWLEGEPELIGANIAYPRDLLEAAGGFPPALGRVGSRLLSNEENAVWRAILARGGRALYDPALRVRHHVAAARVTRRYLLRRMFWQGVSDAVMDLCDGRLGAAAVRRRGWGGLERRAGRWLRVWLPTRVPRRFVRQCAAAKSLGYLGAALGAIRVAGAAGPAGRGNAGLPDGFAPPGSDR